MKKNTFVKLKATMIKVFVIITIIIFIALLIATIDDKNIKSIKEFVKTDTKVLYISNKENKSQYPIKLFKKYEINYLYVNSTNLSRFDKSKLEKMINSKYLSNIVVIYKDGKVVDALIDYESEAKLNKFLQKHNIIPKILGNVKGIIDTVSKLLETDLSIVYLPYKNSDESGTQNEILKRITKQYGIDYKMIDAYLLSESQQEKLNTLLEVSFVEDQIVVLIKDKKIIGSIRGYNRRSYYLNKMYEYKFIDQIQNYVNNIDFKDFQNLLKSENKSVIMIGKRECKYCEETTSILNQIIFNYSIDVNYINIEEIDSDLAIKVEEELKDLGYKDGFTTPITLIVESNKLLDYIIGTSNEEYFVEIFTKNGIIKEEVET